MDIEERTFIKYRNSLKKFIDKWNAYGNKVGWSKIPICISGSLYTIKDELKYIEDNIVKDNYD